MSAETPTSRDAVAGAAAQLDQRRTLDEMSIRLWAISRDLGNSETTNAELCEDAHELEVVARQIRSLVRRPSVSE
jgi:hypothetical protein